MNVHRPEPEHYRDLLVELLGRCDRDGPLDGPLGPELAPDWVRTELAGITASGPVSVTVIGINVERVDTTVTATDGSEWRVVFGSPDGERVHWLHVFTRPPVFDGVPGGRAIVLNGPSGAGKSTLMKAVQHNSIEPWVLFEEPEHVGGAPRPYLIWRDRAPTLHDGYLRAVAALAAAGNLVALAAAGRTQPELAMAFASVPTLWVGLDCDLDVLNRREHGRPGRWGGLAEASLDVHDDWTYDLRFDTTDDPDPDRLAAQILDLLHEHPPDTGT
ncbi:MAG: hypothetical protein AAFZ07_15580 [Actinomycetota bacterium]